MAITYKMPPKFEEVEDATGAIFYIVKYTQDGKRRQKRLHQVPCTCKQGAEYCEHKIRALQAFDMFVDAYGDLQKDDDQSFPIPALIDEYYKYSQEHKIHKPKTLTMIKSHYIKFVNYCRLNNYYRVSALTEDVLKDYIKWLGEQTFDKGGETRNYTDTTININLRNLSTLINYAVAKKYMVENPLSNIGKLKGQKLIKKAKVKQKNILTEEEIKLLKENLKGQWLNIFIFFLYTGVRMSELTHLTWDKIGKDTITIDDNEAIDFSIKGHTARELPIIKSIADVLESQKQYQQKKRIKTDFVFCTKNGTKFSNRNIYRKITDTFKKYEIKGIYNTPLSPHSLRHTFCTLLLDSGCPPTKVQKLMGHKDLKTTLGYARDIGSTYDYVSKLENQDE